VRLTCTDHHVIEILGLRPSNRLPVSYYPVNSAEGIDILGAIATKTTIK
jgi:hypothetical protein